MTRLMSGLVLIVSELRRLRADVLDLRADLAFMRQDEAVSLSAARHASDVRCTAGVRVVEREIGRGTGS